MEQDAKLYLSRESPVHIERKILKAIWFEHENTWTTYCQCCETLKWNLTHWAFINVLMTADDRWCWVFKVPTVRLQTHIVSLSFPSSSLISCALWRTAYTMPPCSTARCAWFATVIVVASTKGSDPNLQNPQHVTAGDQIVLPSCRSKKRGFSVFHGPGRAPMPHSQRGVGRRLLWCVMQASSACCDTERHFGPKVKEAHPYEPAMHKASLTNGPPGSI